MMRPTAVPISLKACKSCMLVKYCNVKCQRKHWSKHKKECKRRAAELRDEALFKDPPAKEDCPICFLPMPMKMVSCMSLPPATITSVPIADYAIANEELADEATKQYYTCCGKSICGGCGYSFHESGNIYYCPFCTAENVVKTNDEIIERIMKRVEANDAGAICQLGTYHICGERGLVQDLAKAMKLLTQAAQLGCSKAHNQLGNIYHEGGDMKKAKFHYETAAMAGHEEARFNLGVMEFNSGNLERAIKHLRIAASAGDCNAMHQLRTLFEKGIVGRESIDTTLAAYNASCAEMRSEARDKFITNLTVER